MVDGDSIVGNVNSNEGQLKFDRSNGKANSNEGLGVVTRQCSKKLNHPCTDGVILLYGFAPAAEHTADFLVFSLELV